MKKRSYEKGDKDEVGEKRRGIKKGQKDGGDVQEQRLGSKDGQMGRCGTMVGRQR